MNYVNKIIFSGAGNITWWWSACLAYIKARLDPFYWERNFSSRDYFSYFCQVITSIYKMASFCKMILSLLNMYVHRDVCIATQQMLRGLLLYGRIVSQFLIFFGQY